MSFTLACLTVRFVSDVRLIWSIPVFIFVHGTVVIRILVSSPYRHSTFIEVSVELVWFRVRDWYLTNSFMIITAFRAFIKFSSNVFQSVETVVKLYKIGCTTLPNLFVCSLLNTFQLCYMCI